jgi:DtxR family Mn-dependent transcriptional regulator
VTDFELSAAAQDYLKVIWNAGEWSDQPVTVSWIAERLNVAAPTASEWVRKLVALGLLEHERYGAVHLTAQGQRQAVTMVRRHRLIETFLVEVLGYGWDEVHDEAEVLEHACSDRMIDAIDQQLGFPKRDPHGDPIPRKDGTLDTPAAVSLLRAEEGRWRVARISDADPTVLRTLAVQGIGLDSEILVTADRPPLAPEVAAAVWVVSARSSDAP